MMKKPIKSCLILTYLFLFASASISCKSQKATLDKGVYLSELDLREAYLTQKIKEAQPDNTDSLKIFKAEYGEVKEREKALGKIIPRLPPIGPCIPPSNCPHIFDLDRLIMPNPYTNVTLQVLNAQGKVLTEARGKPIPSPQFKKFSIFEIDFQNKDIKGINTLKVIKTDNLGKTITYSQPLNMVN